MLNRFLVLSLVSVNKWLVGMKAKKRHRIDVSQTSLSWALSLLSYSVDEALRETR